MQINTASKFDLSAVNQCRQTVIQVDIFNSIVQPEERSEAKGQDTSSFNIIFISTEEVLHTDDV